MYIQNHRLVEVDDAVTHLSSPNVSSGRAIVPKFIVMHYTASKDGGSAINWMMNKRSQVSAHIVIDRQGVITQLVAFNRRAWHAGPSEASGWSDLNSHSIGIELVNMGAIKLVHEDVPHAKIKSYTNASGVKDLLTSADVFRGEYDELQQAYTEVQLATLENLVMALKEEYTGIFDIVGHEEIDTRHKKRDPGEAFPMQRFDKLISSREGGEPVYRTITNLNLRAGPSRDFDVLTTMVDGSEVTVLGQGHRSMWKVKFQAPGNGLADGKRYVGFCHESFLQRIR